MGRDIKTKLEEKVDLVETPTAKEAEPVVLGYAPVAPRKHSISTKTKIVVGGVLIGLAGLAYGAYWYVEGVKAAVTITGAGGR